MAYCMRVLVIVSAAALVAVSFAGQKGIPKDFFLIGKDDPHIRFDPDNMLPTVPSQRESHHPTGKCHVASFEDSPSESDLLRPLFQLMCGNMMFEFQKLQCFPSEFERVFHFRDAWTLVQRLSRPPRLPPLPSDFHANIVEFVSIFPESEHEKAFAVIDILIKTFTKYTRELAEVGVPSYYMPGESVEFSDEIISDEMLQYLSPIPSELSQVLSQLLCAAQKLVESVHPKLAPFVIFTIRKIFFMACWHLKDVNESPNISGVPDDFAIKTVAFHNIVPQSCREETLPFMIVMMLELMMFTEELNKWSITLRDNPIKSPQDFCGEIFQDWDNHPSSQALKKLVPQLKSASQNLVASVHFDLSHIVDLYSAQMLQYVEHHLKNDPCCLLQKPTYFTKSRLLYCGVMFFVFISGLLLLQSNIQ
uniref:Uncharacterized protein n=1 Tax=Spongospora subterranea TaxID=70186 RepID=A0A0H5QML3_9EUKA|eukprot:CRZ02787.1 hypothetical protein [Spongospora subterranea]